MGIRDTLRRYGNAIASAVGIKQDKVQEIAPWNPSRYPRWLHVSKPVHEVPEELQRLVGAKYILDQGKGTTYNWGINQMKRFADGMHGSNKLRRRQRAIMKRRFNELLAGAA